MYVGGGKWGGSGRWRDFEVIDFTFFFVSSLHTDILPVIMKFENHLSRPPVIHNINKLRDEAIRNAAKKLQSGDSSEVDVNSLPRTAASVRRGSKYDNDRPASLSMHLLHFGMFLI